MEIIRISSNLIIEYSDISFKIVCQTTVLSLIIHLSDFGKVCLMLSEVFAPDHHTKNLLSVSGPRVTFIDNLIIFSNEFSCILSIFSFNWVPN